MHRSINLFSKLSCILLLVFTACKFGDNKDFVWDKDIALLTDKNLVEWLRRAPFSNELKQHEDDKSIITNAESVFPFMGRYYDTAGELLPLDTVIYQRENVLYQDPKWGDLFLNATLLYDVQEVFLNNHYTETGNPFFGGVDAMTDTHNADLYETSVATKNNRYKTGIYWATTYTKSYLLGFYQQGQLVFEAAVPLINSDTLASLNKLKEINNILKLNIPEWKNARPAQLQYNPTPKTFWQDPFMELYFSPKTLMHEGSLKIKDTPFKQAGGTPPKGDYYFSYNSSHGLVELYTKIIKDEKHRNETDFNKDHAAGKKYENGLQTIFYDEKTEGNTIKGLAMVYITDGRILELNYGFPKDDRQARTEIHDILKHIKIIKF